ncbi:MAG: DUF1080 domain-containing protein [Planctomycetota bacterium]|nr:DUF1080 domain-containing protein [Planctomycetota bacterium]
MIPLPLLFIAPFLQGHSIEDWRGRPHLTPGAEATWSKAERTQKQKEWDKDRDAHWRMEGNEIVNDGGGVFLTTIQDYGDFSLSLEYKTVAGADSGIYLRGCPQVQIWDWTEAGGKWNLGADKGSGGLWNNQVHSRFPSQRMDQPFGEWNTLRIVMVGSYVSVWMNGTQVVHRAVLENYFDRSQPIPARGPIQLQTHGGEIRWRNISITEFTPKESVAFLCERAADAFLELGREWPPKAVNYEARIFSRDTKNHVKMEEVFVHGKKTWSEVGGRVSAELGISATTLPPQLEVRDLGVQHWAEQDLVGWRKVGEATLDYADGAITGSGSFRQNSFLISEEEFGNFELNVDVKINPGGNSGIQFRSSVDKEGRVSGYQIEIDGSARAWSGGLFEERGRAWLQDLKENSEGRSAFHLGEWNHYRIRCVGDHIRSWVNGIPCADFHDPQSARGIFGFQIHNGGKTTVSWKNLFILSLEGQS